MEFLIAIVDCSRIEGATQKGCKTEAGTIPVLLPFRMHFKMCTERESRRPGTVASGLCSYHISVCIVLELCQCKRPGPNTLSH